MINNVNEKTLKLMIILDCSSPIYCHNGGTCNLINGGREHTCSCADGWKGSNCELVGKFI